MHNTDALWQEFFMAAQAVGQRSMPIADKGLAMTQLGLHYRAREILRQLTAGTHPTVQDGPFAGMQLGQGAEHMSACLARWLGVYEHPLHPAIRAAAARPYSTLINIGAGEGYYAIGMARLMPDLRVIAADTNPDMQAACTALARLNDVAGRITIRGEMNHDALAAAIDDATLIICDIEGAEEQLLNPAACPALLKADFIIELHDVYKPGLSTLMAERYRATHSVEIIEPAAPPRVDKPFVKTMPELDQFLLTHEGRAGHTPWGVFTRK